MHNAYPFYIKANGTRSTRSLMSLTPGLSAAELNAAH